MGQGNLSAEVRRTREAKIAVLPRCRADRRERTRIGRQICERNVADSSLLQFGQNCRNESRLIFRQGDEIAVVSGGSAKKRHAAPFRHGGKGRDSAQGSALVITEKKQRLQRCVVGTLHRQRPLMGVEDLGLNHPLYQRIPLLAQISILGNFLEQDESQGSIHFSQGLANT